MKNRTGPVKHVSNVAINVMYNFCGFVINTTAYHFDRYKSLSPSTKDLHGSAVTKKDRESVCFPGSVYE